MVCIDQCSLEASAPGNVFDDPQHPHLVRAICGANGSAYYPYPTLPTIEGADGHLDARVRTARHIVYSCKDRGERNRVVEAPAAQTVERLQRTSVHALKPCAYPGQLHSPPAQDSLVDESRHQVGDDPVAEFTFDQSSLRLLPGADILNLRHEVKWPAV